MRKIMLSASRGIWLYMTEHLESAKQHTKCKWAKKRTKENKLHIGKKKFWIIYTNQEIYSNPVSEDQISFVRSDRDKEPTLITEVALPLVGMDQNAVGSKL